jgi:glycerol-3-phosphate acyltransferase PlsY
MVHPATAPGALAAACTLVGHSFPVWLGFKGGKGIATSAGVLVALFPAAFLICLGVWMLVFTISRYVSVASLATTVTLPLAVGAMYALHRTDWLGLVVAILMSGLAAWRHRSNIARLRAGTEPRFERKTR